MMRRMMVLGAGVGLALGAGLLLPGSAHPQSAGLVLSDADRTELNSLAANTAQKIRAGLTAALERAA